MHSIIHVPCSNFCVFLLQDPGLTTPRNQHTPQLKGVIECIHAPESYDIRHSFKAMYRPRSYKEPVSAGATLTVEVPLAALMLKGIIKNNGGAIAEDPSSQRQRMTLCGSQGSMAEQACIIMVILEPPQISQDSILH